MFVSQKDADENSYIIELKHDRTVPKKKYSVENSPI